MKDPLNFRTPPEALTVDQIAQNVAPLGPPPNWSRADDVAMIEGLFRGLKLGEIGVGMGKTLPQMMDRFMDLRTAAMGGQGPFTLEAQTRLLTVVRKAAEVVEV